MSKQFRKICQNNIEMIKKIKLPDIHLNCENEAVFIDFRILEHTEFLIRNSVYKLGENWSHTIVCGNVNYLFIKNICDSISFNIRIIKLEYDNIDINTYNNLLLSVSFWKLFEGVKILLYQEDSIIFKNNINDFLIYDFIGAPFCLDINKTAIGNGGFSLRNKQLLIDILLNKNYENFLNIKTKHLSGVILDKSAEDVFFGNVFFNYKIGKIPTINVASLFSSENVRNKDSLGAHQIWKDINWIQRMENLINSYE